MSLVFTVLSLQLWIQSVVLHPASLSLIQQTLSGLLLLI